MRYLIPTIALGALLTAGNYTSAMSISGDVRMVHAPDSVQVGQRTNNRKALLFAEQTNTVLAGDLQVDAFLPGKHSSNTNSKKRTLGAGKTVNSFFLHADTDGSRQKRISGSITFNDKILGVILGDNIISSNALVGAPETAFETAAGHGLDPDDMIRISKNRMRIDFDLNVSGITDQIRIITRGAPNGGDADANPLPEPLTPTLLAMGLGGLVLRRRRVRQTRLLP